MAKQTKKPAKRVFFVRRNIDDVSAFRNVTANPKDLLDFYEGEFYGSAGALEDACEGRSPAFVRGWESGNEAHMDAVESFERSREAGRRSAEAREAKQGTAQPKGGKGFRTEIRTNNRTDIRSPFGYSEQESEGASDIGDQEDPDDGCSASEGGPWGAEYPQEPNRQPNPLRIITEQTTEPSDTHHPVARSHDGGLKMTLSPMRACAHANDEQQEDHLENQDEVRDFQSRRRRIDFPRHGYRHGMLNGAHA